MLASDDAQTDVILAAATVIFGVSLRTFVMNFVWYPQLALTRRLLDVVWVLALTALVPILLARYRNDRAAAFGVRGAGLFREPALLIPSVGVIAVTYLLVPDLLATPQAIFGRATSLLGLLETLALACGTFALITFLSVRARDGYPRSPELPLKQLVRTIGVGAIGITLLFGVLRAFGPRPTATALVFALLYTATVTVLLLLTDRQIPYGLRVSRAAIVAPVVVVAVGYIFFAGGLFRGDLLTGGYLAAIATPTTLLLASRTHLERGTVAVIPFLVTIHLWPTCLSPLVLAPGFC